jgi:hypothetical protein
MTPTHEELREENQRLRDMVDYLQGVIVRQERHRQHTETVTANRALLLALDRRAVAEAELEAGKERRPKRDAVALVAAADQGADETLARILEDYPREARTLAEVLARFAHLLALEVIVDQGGTNPARVSEAIERLGVRLQSGELDHDHDDADAQDDEL